jgi:hypothetical protein
MKVSNYHARQTRRGDEQFLSIDSVLGPTEEPPVASHLVISRGLYSHHGIYVGNGRVIHYGGLAHGPRGGPVEEVPLAWFAHGRPIRVRHESPRFDRSEVVARARSRLGEHCYHLLTNNCEHFCAWALHGVSRSDQVESLRAALVSVWRAPAKVLGDTIVQLLRAQPGSWIRAICHPTFM